MLHFGGISLCHVDKSMSVYRTPPRLKIRHRILARRRIPSIIRTLRHPRRDAPEPAAIFRPRMRPHDATDVLVAVPHGIINVRPLAAQSAFDGAFEGEHGLD